MSSPDSEEELDPTPTRARFIVAAWLCGLASILYLDRICMSQAVKPICDDLHLTNTEASYVAMSFTLAYGLCAVPVGLWGDRRGARSVLTRIVFAWSAFTALTGAATGLVTLVLVRLMFGAAEAGAFPNAAKIMSRWFPVSERGRVQGIMLAFAQVGGVIAPAAAAYLIDQVGWRAAFFVFGSIGVAWAAGFWLWFRDDPATHPGVNKAELAIIYAEEAPAAGSTPVPRGTSGAIPAGPAGDPGPVPWGAIFTNYGIIVLGLTMILGAFFTYFFYTWFPKYLQDARGVDNQTSGWLASLVIGGSGAGMLVGGWLADRTAKLSDPVRARRYLGVFSFTTAAACVFAGVRCDNVWSLGFFWSTAMCTMHFMLPSWWSTIIPQSGKHVGTVFGLTNGVGVMGALVSQGFVGIATDWQLRRGLTGRDAWDPLFDVYVCVLLAGGFAWWLYRFTPLREPEQPNDEDREAAKLKEIKTNEAEG